jgi:adenine-specific DNA-methyltransferase
MSALLSTPTMQSPGPLLLRADARRVDATPGLDASRRAELGQFMTGADVASFIATFFDLDGSPLRLLDPGSGVGSLATAVVERFHREAGAKVSVTAVELDEALVPRLRDTLEDLASELGVRNEVVMADFIDWGADRAAGFAAIEFEPFDLVVMNPPYRKIATGSAERLRVSGLGVEVSNLYAAFVAVASRLVKPGGQLVAIIPRSFANGPYFRSFRTDFLRLMSLRRLHVYEARDSAFGDDGVLQENVILHAVRSVERRSVLVTTSAGVDDQLITVREAPYEQVVRADDPDRFIHLTPDEVGVAVATKIRSLRGTLGTIGCAVSTGRVVDFRTRENLRQEPCEGAAPLIYPTHLRGGRVNWPATRGRKPNGLAINDSTRSLVLPNGCYVLVKRFSSKEEPKRVVAVMSRPEDVPGSEVAFENHLNVFHDRNSGLSRQVAAGLVCYLNSTLVDLFIRQFNGHTQVNASDLRQIPYPTLEQLVSLGEAAGDGVLSQDKIDDLVSAHVVELSDRDGEGPLALHKRVGEAQDVLRWLGLPKAQTNERSALTLLALLNLTADKAWSDIERPLLGITPMMDFMASQYGKRYAPNSRETVRRQTVHQFVTAGLAVINPDDPARPTNSGQTVYQVPEELRAALRAYGSPEWESRLAEWLAAAPALVERWKRVREMNMVPVTLPSGERVELSAGGQNPLIKAVVEEFCPRFAPGGHVLYIGDTGDKFVVWERNALESLGVVVNEKGKMPDVVIHDFERGWLLLVEAVTSHGPVDPKRQEELASLFGDCEAGLVYITAFMDRRTLSDHLARISWETEVWIAEDPTHMVHFDGARFLGPYETEPDGGH